jgi:uncharacterized membrane protein YiaA
MKKVKLYWDLYYPIILAFISFLYSVSLWFSGQKLEGIFVGIWVPSILAMSVAIRQRRNDLFREQAAKRRRFVHIIKNFKMKMIMLIMMGMVIGEDLIHTTMMINTTDQKRKEKVENIMLVKK